MESEFVEKFKNFDPSLAPSCLVILQKLESQFVKKNFDFLVDKVIENINLKNFQIDEVLKILFGLSKLKREKLLNLVPQTCEILKEGFLSPQDCGRILQSYSTLEKDGIRSNFEVSVEFLKRNKPSLRDSPGIAASFRRSGFTQLLNEFRFYEDFDSTQINPKQVAQLAWAHSELETNFELTQFYQNLAEEVFKNLSKYSSRDVIQTLWSFCRFRHLNVNSDSETFVIWQKILKSSKFLEILDDKEEKSTNLVNLIFSVAISPLQLPNNIFQFVNQQFSFSELNSLNFHQFSTLCLHLN